MPFWTPETLRAACAGTWIVRPPQIELPKDRPADLPPPPLHAPIVGLSTDTRTIKSGQVFLALRGENFDGHGYLADAARAGSPILIVDDASRVPAGGFEPAVGVMKVADTAQALLRLAAAYRKTLERTRVVAVCGSNGKTTTTNLIGHVLSTCGLRGTTSKKSFNNAVGVPLTILSAQPTDQFLVCEVGTNAPGEIAQLAEVVSPDIAVLTSIGREHLEKLGDLAGVAREEGSVFKYLRPKGCAVVNADHPELAEHLDKAPMVVSFGRSDKANFRLTAVRHVVNDGDLGLELTFNGRFNARLPLIGEHNAMNALAALAVARRFGVDESRALAALGTARGPDMRLQITTLGSGLGVGGGEVLVINDAYNANPDSMTAAIRTVAAVSRDLSPRPTGGAGRVVIALADMLELGASLADGHIAVARALLETFVEGPGAGEGVPLVILAGPSMAHAHRELTASGWPPRSLVHLAQMDDAAARHIASLIAPGDVVLLKGSRRMKLERVQEALRDRFPGQSLTRPAPMSEPKAVPAIAG